MAATARAILEIVTDASGVQPGIDKTEKSMFSLGGVAGKVGGLLAGAFAITEIASAAVDIVNFAGDLTDLAAKTGVGVEALQGLKYAGSQVGVELETITGGVTALQKRLAEGDKSAVGAVKALSLNFDDLRNMKPEDQFKAIAKEVANVEDPADRVKIAMDLFGKSGAEMLPLLTDEFVGLTERASDLGIVMDEETVASMDLLGDTAGDLMNVGMALIGKVLAPFVPLLTKVAEAAMWLADILGDALGWAVDKIGEGLKWLSLQAISGLRSLLSMGQGITEMFPTLAGAIGLTDSMTGAMKLLDSAEKALTTTREDSTKSTEKAGSATRKLNLDYAGAKKETDETAKAQKKLDDELQKMADTLTGKGLSAEVDKYSKALALAEKQGGLTAHQQAELGKKLHGLVEQGAKLPPALAEVETAFYKTTVKGIPLVSTLESVEAAFKAVKNIALSTPPVVKLPQISLANVAFREDDLARSITAWMNSVPVGAAVGEAGKKSGSLFQGAFGKALEGLGMTIVGAFQGGGDVAKSVGGALLGGLGADLGAKLTKGLTSALGSQLAGAIGSLAGPLGTALGGMLGGVLDKVFSGNDTKKDRESAAKVMGFSSLDALYRELRATGEEGAALAHAGLNVIGKKDKAANDAWIASVQELFAKQKEAALAASAATVEAAQRETAATNAVTDAIRGKIATLDSERDSVFNSIKAELESPEYDEAGQRIYGVIEAQGIARLEQLDKERAALEGQLEESKKEILDTAAVVREGIEEMFRDPIPVVFDVSNFPTGGGGSRPAAFGGAMAEGGVGRVTQPTWFLAGEKPGGEDVAFSGVGRSFGDGGGGATASEIRGLRGDMRSLLSTLPALMESAARHGAQTAGRRR